MASLNPQLQGSTGFEQPVAPAPSVFSALASLGEAFAPAFKSYGSDSQPSYAERKDARDQANLLGLQNSLLKTSEIEAQKGSEAARAYERRVLVDFTRAGGDINDPTIKEAIALVTGQDASLVGKSPQEIAVNELKTSPEYSQYYLASYSFLEDGASEEQRASWAVQKTVQNNAYDIMLQDENFNWVSGNGEQIIGAKVDDFVETRLGGMHALIQNGQPVTLEMLRGAQSEWMVSRTQIQNFLPKEPDLRRNTEDKIKMVDEMFTFFETMTSGSDMTGAEALVFSRNAQTVWHSLQKGKISSIEGNIFLQTMKERPEFFLSSKFMKPSELLETLSALDVTQKAIKTGEAPDLSSVPPEQKGKDAGAVASFWKRLTSFGPRMAPPSEEIAKASVYTIVNNLTGLAKDDKRFLSKNALQNILNDSVVETVKATEGRDGYLMADSMFQAIDQQYAVAEMAMISMLRGSGITWDKSSNSLYVSEEQKDRRLLEDAAAMSGSSSLSVKMQELNKQLALINFLNDRRLEFAAIRDDKIEGAAGDSEAEGSAGGDTLSYQGSTMDLIKEFEGFRSTPYWDVNAFRVGFGSDTITKPDGTVVKVTEGMKVSREDAERDLNRRTQEFIRVAQRQVGSDVWSSYPSNIRAALTSIAYNYGSLPERILGAARNGDAEVLALAVENLAGDNEGVNRKRRLKEAAIIRGGPIPENGPLVYSPNPPVTAPRPEITPDSRESVEVGGDAATQQPLRAAESAADSPRSAPEGVTTGQPSEAALQAAQRTFDQLSQEQKDFLERLLGPEEETVFMLATKQIQKEDIPK